MRDAVRRKKIYDEIHLSERIPYVFKEQTEMFLVTFLLSENKCIFAGYDDSMYIHI
jgi:hypothetical protein